MNTMYHILAIQWPLTFTLSVNLSVSQSFSAHRKVTHPLVFDNMVCRYNFSLSKHHPFNLPNDGGCFQRFMWTPEVIFRVVLKNQVVFLPTYNWFDYYYIYTKYGNYPSPDNNRIYDKQL